MRSLFFFMGKLYNTRVFLKLSTLDLIFSPNSAPPHFFFMVGIEEAEERQADQATGTVRGQCLGVVATGPC